MPPRPPPLRCAVRSYSGRRARRRTSPRVFETTPYILVTHHHPLVVFVEHCCTALHVEYQSGLRERIVWTV